MIKQLNDVIVTYTVQCHYHNVTQCVWLFGFEFDYTMIIQS